MASSRSRWSSILALSVALASSACGGGSKPEAKSPTSESSSDDGPAEVGKGAPAFSIETLNNKGKVSRESLAGKLVVVDFWATWCGPCKESLPALEELQKQGRAEVVGISVDDSKDGVADFAKEHGASFAIGWDEGHSIANRWKVGTMPTTYILDGTGKVRFIHAGYHSGEKDEIKKELATLEEEAGGGSSSKAATTETKPEPKPEPKPAADETKAPTAASGDEPSDETAKPKPKKGGKKTGGGAPKKAPGKKPPAKK